LTFGSTGLLTKQIENGAPFDVFAAANESYIAQLEKEGHDLPGTSQLYALGRIVLWTRKDGPPSPPNITALMEPRYRKIALANPEHAPYGVAAREAMQAAHIWNAVQPRLVYGENIQQTLQYVESGNAEVGIVALSLAIGSNGDYTSIPQERYKPLR